jgi:hypothetical protein
MVEGELDLGFDSGGDENARWTWVGIGSLSHNGCLRMSWTWVLRVVMMRIRGRHGLG